VVKRIATGSCDKLVRVYRCIAVEGRWEWRVEKTLGGNGGGHTDWVRDVAWAPASGMPCNLIASCSEVRWGDGTAFVVIMYGMFICAYMRVCVGVVAWVWLLGRTWDAWMPSGWHRHHLEAGFCWRRLEAHEASSVFIARVAC